MAREGAMKKLASFCTEGMWIERLSCNFREKKLGFVTMVS
jgi:hypothetical protein